MAAFDDNCQHFDSRMVPATCPGLFSRNTYPWADAEDDGSLNGETNLQYIYHPDLSPLKETSAGDCAMIAIVFSGPR